MSNAEEVLIEFIKHWGESNKEENQMSFITPFLELLKNADYQDFEFDGDGSYFGKQVTFKYGNCYSWNTRSCLNFEIAYSKDQITVYTANNNGFWVAPYLSLAANKNTELFQLVDEVVKEKLSEVFGL